LIKAKWIYWLLQLTGWGSFVVLLGITEYLTQNLTKATVYQLLVLYISLVTTTQLMRYVLLKFGWVDLKIKQLIPRAILLNYSISLLLTFILLLTNTILTDQVISFEVLPTIFLNSLIYMLFLLMWTSIYMTYHLFNKNRKQELEYVELRASKVEMELKNLRNQLNPHFLFNALNSIRALVQEDPEKSKESITSLSGLLRGSLQLGKRSLVTLGEEKQLVEDYLELEKIRFEERLNYRITDLTSSKWLIPPFCIQTLVENSIKHGISKLAKGGDVFIAFTEDQNELSVVIKNSGKLLKKESNGIGLENVKQRLQYQFGENAYFHIQQVNEYVEAIIKIKK